MARLPYVDPANAPEPVRDALERVPPLNIFRMMANAESAFRPWLRWGALSCVRLQLDPVLRELAILRVARLTPNAEYEWVQHVPIARPVGARDEQIAALERDEPEAECFSDVERRLSGSPPRSCGTPVPGMQTLESLKQTLSPREIVELLMVIGQYMMLARVMATTDMELDEPAGLGARRH